MKRVAVFMLLISFSWLLSAQNNKSKNTDSKDGSQYETLFEDETSEKDIIYNEREAAISKREAAVALREIAVSEREAAVSKREEAVSKREKNTANNRSTTSTTTEGYTRSKEADFRQCFWGESLSAVKSKEGKTNISTIPNSYGYETMVAGYPCMAYFYFTNNKLTNASYQVLDNNSDNCERRLNDLVELLTKKYGKPVAYNKKDRNYSSSFSLGKNIYYGMLIIEVIWNTPNTKVVLNLYSEQYKIYLNIDYFSNQYGKVRENDMLDDL